MAGVKPFFITGDKLKIKLDGKTVAFATDLMCSVQMMHQTPHVLGMYEGVSVEPLSYNVSGSFSIIRYVKNAIGNIGVAPPGTNPQDIGNSASTWGGGYGNALSVIGGTQGRANQSLDPSTFAQGTTFDIEVYQKFTENPSDSGTDNLLGIIKIRSARITKADFGVNKKSPGVDRFEFVALYMDNDAAKANPSGTGQQNS